MASWAEFERDRPDLATAGHALLYQFGVGLGFLATVRRDGGPRVHPMCPLIHGGGMYAFIVPGPKQADLHRDGRYALHSFPCEDNEDAFYCTGRAEADEDAVTRQVLADIFVTERAGAACRCRPRIISCSGSPWTGACSPGRPATATTPRSTPPGCLRPGNPRSATRLGQLPAALHSRRASAWQPRTYRLAVRHGVGQRSEWAGRAAPWASRGTVLLTDWEAAGLRMSISAEEERSDAEP